MNSALLQPHDLYPRGGGTSPFNLLDVRAPVEFARGAMPYTFNEPILTNEERHLVGVRYKEAGQAEAVALGYKLTDAAMPGRVARWRAVCEGGPTAVTCWRGGLRSELATDFIDLPELRRVAGGYKALRAFVTAEAERLVPTLPTLVIAGLTGTGKTDLLNEVGRARDDALALDLEAEANHRGSAFGNLGPQPSQATFENSLSTKLVLSPARWLVLEDESRNVGERQLPDPFFHALQTSPVVLVEEPLARRIENIHRDYVLVPSEHKGVEEVRAFLESRLLRLKRRLGGPRVTRGVDALDEAARGGAWGESEAHRAWIAPLLTDYYDPLYRKSLDKMNRRVLFRGAYEECAAWLSRQPLPPSA